jgi:hypothetical protein
MWPYLPQNPNCCTDCEQSCTSSNTVCYTGPNLPCSGVNTNDTITVVLQKIDNVICELIAINLTTTTTTMPIVCTNPLISLLEIAALPPASTTTTTTTATPA